MNSPGERSLSFHKESDDQELWLKRAGVEARGGGVLSMAGLNLVPTLALGEQDLAELVRDGTLPPPERPAVAVDEQTI